MTRVHATGYFHERYAASLGEFGTPRRLAASDGWLLERPIPESTATDAMGCYPLFSVRRWNRLDEDFEFLRNRFVSVTTVCDPFTAPGPSDLGKVFDIVRPFKRHVAIDFRHPSPTPHHYRAARRALKRVRIDEVADPPAFLDEWCGLYEELARRHCLGLLQRFSRRAFALQLSVPGVRVFRASSEGVSVGAQLWYVSGGVAYLHLQASSPKGYDLEASYGLVAEALDRLRSVADFACLGGGTGAYDDASDGLLRFKRGWSSDSREVYLCGRILDPEVYRTLTGSYAIGATYFPAYRDREFTGGLAHRCQ